MELLYPRETTLSCCSGDLSSVNLQLAAGLSNSNDKTLFLQNSDCLSSQRSVDLDSLRNDGRGDELGLWDILNELVPDNFVKHDGILNLILLLALRPLLPLRLAAAHGGLHLGLLRLDLSLRHPASARRGKRRRLRGGVGVCGKKGVLVVSGGGQRAPRGGEKTQPRGGRGYEMAARAKRWGGEHAPGEPRSEKRTCGGLLGPGGL